MTSGNEFCPCWSLLQQVCLSSGQYFGGCVTKWRTSLWICSTYKLKSYYVGFLATFFNWIYNLLSYLHFVWIFYVNIVFICKNTIWLMTFNRKWKMINNDLSEVCPTSHTRWNTSLLGDTAGKSQFFNLMFRSWTRSFTWKQRIHFLNSCFWKPFSHTSGTSTLNLVSNDITLSSLIHNISICLDSVVSLVYWAFTPSNFAILYIIFPFTFFKGPVPDLF